VLAILNVGHSHVCVIPPKPIRARQADPGAAAGDDDQSTLLTFRFLIHGAP
jgi:hypothetical protein